MQDIEKAQIRVDFDSGPLAGMMSVSKGVR